ncbi:hypothetical protein CSOJ01_09782 [Colletotrichum sojae]|uniref:Fungal-type protein kinase domain-containing protein n=1 Tax=Colletotrichum sojae TaxID=2175907 RepID=A0A8H6J2P6_9PEZI|nr:hypothetical protein CSOJ01_09782 [Colletotrichum sojae]
MELWAFDRSGMYSCDAFDIAQDPDGFATIVVGYMLMSDIELGVGDLIGEDDQGKYISCGDDTAGVERLYLGEPTIFERTNKNVVSDGLTCYRAKSSASKPWEYAIKLKWSPAGEKSEAKMLALVKGRNPWGVLRLLHHRGVCDTDGLHQDLVLGKPRELRPDATAAPSGGEVGSVLGHTVETPGADDPVDNKFLDCSVVAPLGLSLHRFESVPELLEALLDAVKAHRSLCQDGDVLHQDVCPGNIIIPPSSSGGAKPIFPTTRTFDHVRRKTNDMDAANFNRITAEFTPEFHRLSGLATTLRGILSSTRDGQLWTGTDMTVLGTETGFVVSESHSPQKHDMQLLPEKSELLEILIQRWRL